MYDQPVMFIMPDLKSDGQEFGHVPPGKSVSGYQAQPTRPGQWSHPFVRRLLRFLRKKIVRKFLSQPQETI